MICWIDLYANRYFVVKKLLFVYLLICSFISCLFVCFCLIFFISHFISSQPRERKEEQTRNLISHMVSHAADTDYCTSLTQKITACKCCVQITAHLSASLEQKVQDRGSSTVRLHCALTMTRDSCMYQIVKTIAYKCTDKTRLSSFAPSKLVQGRSVRLGVSAAVRTGCCTWQR